MSAEADQIRKTEAMHAAREEPPPETIRLTWAGWKRVVSERDEAQAALRRLLRCWRIDSTIRQEMEAEFPWAKEQQ